VLVGDNLPENVTYHGICHASFLLGFMLTCTSKLPVNFTYLELTIQLLLVLSWPSYPFILVIAFIVTVLGLLSLLKEYSPGRNLAALKSTKKLL
jgi:hypothetical protein